MNRAQLIHQNPQTWAFLLEDGCEVSSRCDRCPLRQCRLDDHHWFQSAKDYARDYLIVQARERNAGNAELTAIRLGVAVRTVYRAQKKINKYPDLLTRAELDALIPLVELQSFQTRQPVKGVVQVRLL